MVAPNHEQLQTWSPRGYFLKWKTWSVELVRRARTKVQHCVNVGCRDPAGAIAFGAFGRPLRPTGEAMPFVAFMETLDVDALDLTREPDTGRDVAL